MYIVLHYQLPFKTTNPTVICHCSEASLACAKNEFRECVLVVSAATYRMFWH